MPSKFTTIVAVFSAWDALGAELGREPVVPVNIAALLVVPKVDAVVVSRLPGVAVPGGQSSELAVLELRERELCMASM